LLNLREREAEIVELANPADTRDGSLIVEAIATLRASVRAEQAHILIVVNRAHRLAARFGDISDLKEPLAVLAALVRPVRAGRLAPSLQNELGARCCRNRKVSHRTHPGLRSTLTLTHASGLPSGTFRRAGRIRQDSTRVGLARRSRSGPRAAPNPGRVRNTPY